MGGQIKSDRGRLGITGVGVAVEAVEVVEGTGVVLELADGGGATVGKAGAATDGTGPPVTVVEAVTVAVTGTAGTAEEEEARPATSGSCRARAA